MKNTRPVVALLLLMIFVAGCASLSAPQRPAYDGADKVTSANPDQLIGIWQVTELNPIGAREPQVTVIEYRDDGSVTGTTTLQDEEFEAFAPIELVIDGHWTLAADIVTHADITMSSTSDDEIGSIISQMMNNQNEIAGQANIHELTADRIVMVGSDGVAMEYTRALTGE